MPRPPRIEYPGAFYHVMNRGRGRQWIFHGAPFFKAFLVTLEEAYQRFDARIHAYCLMSNHYHIIIETPNGNLSRIMRHINGLYTQRYNRLKNTDGPLFRGRYKAILVDYDHYLLPLGRYIHRNPVDMKKPLVRRLQDYLWSSYPAYIGKVDAPQWLSQTLTYQILGKHTYKAAYKTYVESGVDEEIQEFYGKGNVRAVLGGKEFRKKALKRNKVPIEPRQRKKLAGRPTIGDIIDRVSKVYGVSPDTLRQSPSGRRHRNLPRKIAMYLTQHVGDYRLSEIAEAFNVNHPGSVSNAIHDVKQLISLDRAEEQRIFKILNMIQGT